MSKTDFSAALTGPELDRLAAFLAQFPGAMNLERMDGFFSALICAPQTAPMGEAMSLVWGDEADFASEAEAREIAALLMRHWNTISRRLAGDDLYWPILLEDEAGQAHANAWAHGFRLGMELSGGWSPLFDDEEQGGWIVPILALAHEHDPDPTMRPGVIDQQRREEMIAGMVAGLKKIHGYFAPQRRADGPGAAATPRRRASKIGRNDPCPCGSGRKFKRCCGAQPPTLH